MIEIAARSATSRGRRRVRVLAPGACLALVVAALATVAGHLEPMLGAPVAAVLLGAAVSTAWPRARARRYAAGLRATGSTVLQAAVVLLGAQVSAVQVLHTGAQTMPVMLGTLAACLVGAYVLGRALGVDGDLRTLIGVGTAICGATAIAATVPVLRPSASRVAYALTTVFLLNIVAVVTFPPLGHLLGLSQHAFGVFAGTAVNDTSSVVAAAATYGRQATDTAVVVKLTRALMIIPVTLGLALVLRQRGRGDGDARPAVWAMVPWFLLGFLALATVNSVCPLPGALRSALATAAMLLITWALSAIGLSTDLGALRRAGVRPLLLGGALWLVVSTFSLGLQAAFLGLH
ncbi:putative sulfate exporter family transporter [Tsukamurella sp. 8F]|uniref:YeiH family protein n=1 Tax=unclassified Tsukamurella TaxID=2633480 RepID=UPI0023B92128|nr:MULTISPECIES: putative sulfate exporter family transporter [unclassified Tsukamurella]MDF0529281.1 putative sulfate exporter family transporter [Tsukamurella sp. 8J]MDF0586882.1 putative sulfate exporter family transporter [Tsukamurella sp. 8F]